MSNWMMCFLCFPDSHEIGAVTPSCWLIHRHQRDYCLLGASGHTAHILYEFAIPPMLDPNYEALLNPDCADDDLVEDHDYMLGLQSFIKEFRLPLDHSYAVVEEALELGWNIEDGGIYPWLYERCGLLIQMYNAGCRA